MATFDSGSSRCPADAEIDQTQLHNRHKHIKRDLDNFIQAFPPSFFFGHRERLEKATTAGKSQTLRVR
jgi:hypothetical protein